ncbi:putative u4 u6 snrna-associated-splicing factor prp24 protein [Phaeoacremonium minimum UCRPA7]|uniref:U4/U6 snRNA-associated-splicing factor PRP24 n=1 Tax=Phaeoacremonium minimum (strain UCR-PA7) TaxID=1286976 RepID=R8BJE6_PHAM7|nr:putative u4 u6 snrna-associated-splicing factor prp24 protein [Phaeoacremonium minimum UCRPA7]EON99441.1 putative u4 u6 snrna-associated-splicing factor prp24 protein [Phaeoacremonium minimum UCRPA7]
MPNQQPPVGEDAWVAVAESRRPTDLLSRIENIELFKQAVSAEPGSLKIWVAYCDYFWSLYAGCQPHSDAGWSREEQAEAGQLFTLDAALSLWQTAYEATRYRLNDSHELWNRWISLEMELLARTRTPEGVKRITHLFRNRLQTPHKTWDETSQMFSTFLSEYNRAAWESTMQEITSLSKEAKKIYESRDPFELKLDVAAREGKEDDYKAVMRDYLDWETKQNMKEKKHKERAIEICVGLFSRALTGVFSRDESAWTDYIVWLSTQHSFFAGQLRSMEILQALPRQLDVLQRAVQHCPWSGDLWARYILSAEEAGLAFHDIERIKHAATDSAELDRDDLTGVIEMYAAWCGYLKRRAMDPNATDEDSDVADLGLVAALEDVQIWGKRIYGDAYKGDPNFRLERILIQYLTEKKGAIDEAREHWQELATKDLYGDSYNFWLTYYMWELSVFLSQKGKALSPTPGPGPRTLKVPSMATDVLQKAISKKTLDWPERVMEIYLQHCNDYETPETLHRAFDTVYRTRKGIAKRREREAVDAAAAYSAQYAQYQEQAQQAATQETGPESPSGSKRKRELTPGAASDTASKRVKNESEAELVKDTATTNEHQQEPQKRDREHTSIIVTSLPAEATQTKIKQYFREYGHIKNFIHKVEEDGNSAVAVIEFDTFEEAQSALLRDGKYFDQQQITVKLATGLTLFVTNFPPRADDAFIQELFKDCGEILSIRWPSLKYNTHRRFCYVTFRDAEGATKATKFDDTKVEGRYTLEVKHSNPGQKKQREPPKTERKPAVHGPPASTAPASKVALMAPPPTIKRPVLGKGQAKRGLGFAGAISKETKVHENGSNALTNGTSTAPAGGGKKSNDDFRSMLLNKNSTQTEQQQQQQQNGLDTGAAKA